MTYTGWRIIPHKLEAHLNEVAVTHFYYVIDEQRTFFDYLNAVYDRDGEAAIYSLTSREYINPLYDNPYFSFILSELTTDRVIEDIIRSVKSPIDRNGIISFLNF